MNGLQAIHTTFLSQNFRFTHPVKLSRKRKPTLRFCSSDGAGSEGDKRQQDLLARIAMIQTEKIRLTDFLDERSTYLTQFAEEADVEFDKIGENALKELDEASDRVMQNLDNRMRALEGSRELNRQEIEENEKVSEDFEKQIEKDRNEGLFFKNLALIALLAITIGNSVLATSEVEWRKVAALGLILIGLLAQFIYEQSLSTETSYSSFNPYGYSS